MEPLRAPRKAFLSIQTVASELDLNEATIRKAVQRGDIPSIRVGHVYRIPREAIEAWKRREK